MVAASTSTRLGLIKTYQSALNKINLMINTQTRWRPRRDCSRLLKVGELCGGDAGVLIQSQLPEVVSACGLLHRALHCMMLRWL